MKKILLLFVCVFYLGKINAQNCSFTVTPVSGTYTICNSSSVTFFVSGGGSGNYTWTIDSVWAPGVSGGPGGYVWTAPLVVGTSSFVTLSPTVTTKYNVADTSGGCNTVQSVVVTVNPNPTITINTNSVVCQWYPATIIASGAQSYTWSPNPNTISVHGDTATFNTNSSSVNVFTVTATDTNGCSASATTTVTTDYGPNVSYVSYTGCANVAHSYVVLYGAQIYNCQSCYGSGIMLVGGDTLINYLATSQTYTLLATDANGCNSQYMDIITVNPMPVFTASSATVCNGQTANLTASDNSLQYVWTNQAGNYTSNVQNPSIANVNSSLAGNYFVTGTDGNGCYNTDTVTVTVTPPVTVSYVMNKDTALANTWDAYPTYSPLVTSARWYWGDGTSTTGLYPSHTYAAAGIYNIWVTAFSSCGDSGAYFQNVSIYRLASNTVDGSNPVYVNIKHGTPTDIATLAVNNALTIYPNPSNGDITIASTSNIDNVKITNMLGQVVYETKPNTESATLQLSNAGVYFVTITSGKEVSTKKIIVNK